MLIHRSLRQQLSTKEALIGDLRARLESGQGVDESELQAKLARTLELLQQTKALLRDEQRAYRACTHSPSSCVLCGARLAPATR